MHDRDDAQGSSSAAEIESPTDDIEVECSICTNELQGLSVDTGGPSSDDERPADADVVESSFRMTFAEDQEATYLATTIESPAQAQAYLESTRNRLMALHESFSVGREDPINDGHDEDFDSPEMFEYANPGLHVDYIDTDIHLERSLDFRDLLESESLSSDALSSYRSGKVVKTQRVSAADVRNGMDMQGIRWKRGLNARKEYRQYRLSTYENYFNANGPYRGRTTPSTCLVEERSFLRFVQNEIEFKCSLVHFQLRNLLTALDKNSIYHTDTSIVKMYDPQEHSCKVIMDLTDCSMTYPFKISSLAMANEYCCVGGFFGEYALKRLECADEAVHVGLVTTDMTGITNHLCPQIRRSGGHQLTISSNDSCLRKMDVETLKLTQERYLEHPLNCSATSADKRIQIVVGDHCSSLLLDAENGEILQTIEGHTDFSFACAWSSDGYTFATGSQDLTTRLYDARGDMSTPIAIYRASIGAIRSLKFSECGRFLAVAEPADFVHLYDMHDKAQSQCIDFFGEISGIDFAGDSFFIGNADRNIGGISEFEMRRDRLGLEHLLL